MTAAPGAVSLAGPAPVAAFTGVAALPMYDWPGLHRANDALWRALAVALRERGFDPPPVLDRSRPADEIWRDPRLLIAQTCGYPLVSRLTGHVRPVATLCYAAGGCAGPLYSSHLVVRRDEPAGRLAEMAGRIAAINGRQSQSGCAALHHACLACGGPEPFFAGTVSSGSHLGSMRAVAAGRADVAAIDAVCWALAARCYPKLAGRLRSLGTTAPTPGLPFVTAVSRPDSEVALIHEALAECLADPRTSAPRRKLLVTGMEVVGLDEYRAAIAPLLPADIARTIPL
jgi:ABC-type phosphate/phosphonate transport system substrate-binding protein